MNSVIHRVVESDDRFYPQQYKFGIFNSGWEFLYAPIDGSVLQFYTKDSAVSWINGQYYGTKNKVPESFKVVT